MKVPPWGKWVSRGALKSKYRYLPGDAPAFGGDGDGAIDTTAASGTDNWGGMFTCELANFWNNAMPDNYVASICGSGPEFSVAAKSSGSNKNVPAAKVGINGAFFVASAIGFGGSTVIAGKNYYSILHPSQTTSNAALWHNFHQTTSNNSAVKPVEMLALDKKLDDGVANAGIFVSGNIPNAGGYGSIFTSPLATCSSGANYILTNAGYECTPLIRIGSQTGSPL